TIWLALDPTFGPRQLALGTPLLGYHYLCALVFGYCTGYFLLFAATGTTGANEVRATGAPRGWERFRSEFKSCAPRLAAGAGIVLAFALPVMLAAKNLPQILTTNGPWLRIFARQLYADLPPGKSVVLSDSTAEL